MQTEPSFRDLREPAQRRVLVARRRRAREPEPLDLRTPSGRVLPY